MVTSCSGGTRFSKKQDNNYRDSMAGAEKRNKCPVESPMMNAKGDKYSGLFRLAFSAAQPAWDELGIAVDSKG